MPLRPAAASVPGRLTTRSDSLLILAYRCWHAGYDYGDADCWQYAATVLSRELGPREARSVLNAVQDFVHAMREVSDAPADYYPPPCCRASQGERRVLHLLAALQRDDRRMAEKSLRELCPGTINRELAHVLSRARKLAMNLSEVGLALSADSAGEQAPDGARQLH